MSEIDEKRAAKNGVLTPLGVAKRMLQEVEQGDVESVVCVVLKKGGGIEVGYSSGNVLEHLGLTEVLKNDLLADVLENL